MAVVSLDVFVVDDDDDGDDTAVLEVNEDVFMMQGIRCGWADIRTTTCRLVLLPRNRDEVNNMVHRYL